MIILFGFPLLGVSFELGGSFPAFDCFVIPSLRLLVTLPHDCTWRSFRVYKYITWWLLFLYLQSDLYHHLASTESTEE